MRARGHCIADGERGSPPLSPRPFLRTSVLRRFAPIGASGISLDEIDHFNGESESQRRFAPMVIDEDEIVDRFQLKSVIVPVKIRNRPSNVRHGVATIAVVTAHQPLHHGCTSIHSSSPFQIAASTVQHHPSARSTNCRRQPPPHLACRSSRDRRPSGSLDRRFCPLLRSPLRSPSK